MFFITYQFPNTDNEDVAFLKLPPHPYFQTFPFLFLPNFPAYLYYSFSLNQYITWTM